MPLFPNAFLEEMDILDDDDDLLDEELDVEVELVDPRLNEHRTRDRRKLERRNNRLLRKAEKASKRVAQRRRRKSSKGRFGYYASFDGIGEAVAEEMFGSDFLPKC